jgi:hypothetical protein
MSFFKLLRKSQLFKCPFSNCRESLDCRDVLFQTVEKISIVEMSFFKLSRKSQLLRCPFSNCRENLDCRDVLFQTVEKISIVEMSFFKLLRKSQLSRCPFSNCQENLNCRDVLFQAVERILTVKMSFFKLSRSRLSIATRSRQIETPTLICDTSIGNIFINLCDEEFGCESVDPWFIAEAWDVTCIVSKVLITSGFDLIVDLNVKCSSCHGRS